MPQCFRKAREERERKAKRWQFVSVSWQRKLTCRSCLGTMNLLAPSGSGHFEIGFMRRIFHEPNCSVEREIRMFLPSQSVHVFQIAAPSTVIHAPSRGLRAMHAALHI